MKTLAVTLLLTAAVLVAADERKPVAYGGRDPILLAEARDGAIVIAEVSPKQPKGRVIASIRPPGKVVALGLSVLERRYLAAAMDDGLVVVWTLKDAKEHSRLWCEGVNDLGIREDELFIRCEGNSQLIWSLAKHEMTLDYDLVPAIREGLRIARVSAKGRVEIRQASDRKLLRAMDPGEEVRHLTFSKGATYVAVATAKRVVVWEAETGKEYLRFPYQDAARLLFRDADLLIVCDRKVKDMQSWSMRTKAQVLPSRPKA